MKNLKKLRSYLNSTQENIAIQLNVNPTVISNYETGTALPSFKSFLKLANIFQISFDYLIAEENCFYPRNLKLLRLAKKLDDFYQPESRGHIEISVKNFLINDIKDLKVNQDDLSLILSNDFHKNLKILRNKRGLSQKIIGQELNITTPTIAMYEKNRFPAAEKLQKLSALLDISIHALTTGEKLSFDFQDRQFGTTMLSADHFLTLDQHKVLITLMQAILQNKS